MSLSVIYNFTESWIFCKDKNRTNCTELSMRMETTSSLSDTMFVFELFQSGLIFSALTAGLVSICHVIYCRAIICRNSSLLLVLILTGFCHMLVCVYLLQISEQSALYEIPNGGHQRCTDYYLPATLANTIILASIVHNIIRLNVKSMVCAGIVWAVSVGSIVVGLLCLARLHEFSPPVMQQETFVSLGRSNETHLDVFWSVCKKEVYAEKIRLLAEYGLIYIPVIIIVLFAWHRSFKRNKDASLLRIRIVDTSCCDDETDLCVCSRLGPTFVAVLAYSAVILLIARPVMIMYAHATSGYFRDILPSLLHTVMYCFICSEYLSRALRYQTRFNAVGYVAKDKKRKVVLHV
ncbi:uncharacterized protein LOC128559579 [Mercenaria mercenaria]|uniref:uncharacterized protein LOC128559579 n=1 Tax=Mercenaria mercenaria TaxID=6596 RepID=UPI00234E3D99|nr:uncharacterized protein LOC128559579 [Mercenaria mercenaria]